MDDAIRDKALMVVDFAADAEGLRQWSAIARAFVLALVYLGDCIRETAQVPEPEKEEDGTN